MVRQFVRRSVQQLFSHSATSAASHRTTVSAAAACVSSPASSVAPASAHAAGRTRPQPQHTKADPTGVVAGVAIVGALVGVGKMWWDASSSGGVLEPEAVPTISQAELGLFLEELTAAVKELFVRAWVVTVQLDRARRPRAYDAVSVYFGVLLAGCLW